LEKLDDVHIIWTWGSIRADIKASATESLCCELKQHKPYFDEEHSKLLGEKKQARGG
jgi:hypothetical protein